jgi:sulfatase modifying factor 1
MAAPMKPKIMWMSPKFLVLILIIGFLSVSVCGDSDQESCSNAKDENSKEKACGCGALNRKTSESEESGGSLEQDGDDSSAAAELVAEEDDDATAAGTDATHQGDTDHDKLKYSKIENMPVFPRTNQMVLIKGGDFFMGTEKPLIPPDGEGPARRIKISSFYVDVHEVSNAEFEQFTKKTGYVTEVSCWKWK